jgi:tetratricopeptide (TPR) repeat protein
MRGRARTAGLIATVAIVLLLSAAVASLGGAPARAAEPAFWDKVASRQRERAERLVQKAKDLLAYGGSAVDAKRPQGVDTLARAEAMLHEALALDAPDFTTLLLLADVQSLRGNVAEAAATLERAESLARLPAQRSVCWFRLGIERSKLGRYREAVASYDAQIALGEADATVYANAAELLMALGRLGEAEDRYREAIRIDERAGDRRGHEQGLAFSYYGLGVALDRDSQEVAAREAIGRALAMDPNMSMLHLAQQPGADVFFIPEGDVYYYLGLGAEVAGRPDDASVAFARYIAQQTKSAWASRASAHLDALTSLRTLRGGPGAAPDPAKAPPPVRPRWRVLAFATVVANGPIPAPLIDAALKQRPPAWAQCLAPFPAPPGHQTVRLVVDLDIDANGVVSRALAQWPRPPSGVSVSTGASPCMEAALKDLQLVAKPAHGKVTSARIEVLLANGDSGGL